MKWDVYGMDTYFRHSLGTYPFDARCEILADLGYDATYLTLFERRDWADVDKFHSTSEYELSVAGLYKTVEIEESDNEFEEFLDLVNEMEACEHVELALQTSKDELDPSDSDGDDAALERIQSVLKANEDATVSLYPHVGNWMERSKDALRLCECLDHPRLGVAFPSFHWYAVDGTDLPSLFDSIAPYLTSVNLCGTRKPAPTDADLPATIEPLGRGELDNFAILGQLQRIGYEGRIGLQGYSVGGDVYTKLKKSLEQFRDMECRLERHPNWAEIRFDRYQP